MPFVNLKELRQVEPVPGFHLRFVHSDAMTIAFWDVEEGAVMPEHSHSHEQIAVVVEGEFELTLSGETRLLSAGEIAVIPSGEPHSGEAMSRCRLHDAFHPKRDDFDVPRTTM
ncbi:MAG: cupin domain-containing protein [Candidatus Eisenbacteria bacterium]|nr:cupin domain-containing protein [Candidatus Eisenbacteria bacterium]